MGAAWLVRVMTCGAGETTRWRMRCTRRTMRVRGWTGRTCLMSRRTAGRGDWATWTAPPPMIAPPHARAQSFAKAILTDIACSLPARWRADCLHPVRCRWNQKAQKRVPIAMPLTLNLQKSGISWLTNNKKIRLTSYNGPVIAPMLKLFAKGAPWSVHATAMVRPRNTRSGRWNFCAVRQPVQNCAMKADYAGPQHPKPPLWIQAVDLDACIAPPPWL